MAKKVKVFIPPLILPKRIFKNLIGRKAYAVASRYWTYVLGLAIVSWAVFIRLS